MLIQKLEESSKKGEGGYKKHYFLLVGLISIFLFVYYLLYIAGIVIILWIDNKVVEMCMKYVSELTFEGIMIFHLQL